jgi:hypothetical protein
MSQGHHPVDCPLFRSLGKLPLPTYYVGIFNNFKKRTFIYFWGAKSSFPQPHSILLEPSHTKRGCGRRSRPSTPTIQWPNAARISSETPQRWVRNIAHQVRGSGLSSVSLAPTAYWGACGRVVFSRWCLDCDWRCFDVPASLRLRQFVYDSWIDLIRPVARGGKLYYWFVLMLGLAVGLHIIIIRKEGSTPEYTDVQGNWTTDDCTIFCSFFSSWTCEGVKGCKSFTVCFNLSLEWFSCYMIIIL